MRFNTKLLHGKSTKKYADNSTLPPIAQVSAFGYESAEEQEKVFQHKASGYAYTRIGNPTIAAFEQRISELENAAGGVACSSGMAAVTISLLNVLSSGDEIITTSNLYGGTLDLFKDLEKLGIKTNYVSELNSHELDLYFNEHTKVIFGEVVSNPALQVLDIKAVSDYAHSKGIPLIVDATTVTPYVIRPIELGADIVVHSSSKYINGGGNSISGIILDSGKFKWDFEKFSALKEFKKYGNLAYLIRLKTDLWENFGSCLAPFNAYLNIVGLETLGLRIEQINRNARALAVALAKLDGITVSYLSLPDHPYYDLCTSQLKGYGGGILTFRVGSKEKAFKILNALQFATIASNIGDVRTLAIHPKSTLYIKSTDEEAAAAGVYDDTIRVSVGIEDSEDLIEDFTQAIEKASA